MVDGCMEMPIGFHSEDRTYGFAVYCDDCGMRIGGFRENEVDVAKDRCRKHKC
jgi:hypothetical protein